VTSADDPHQAKTANVPLIPTPRATYAWWNESRTLDQLGPGALDGLPSDVSLFPTYADIGDQIERKITGISLYESQIERLFESTREMAGLVRAYGKSLGIAGDLDAPTERYWRSSRV
jgi:hypothetical protein